MDTLTGKKAKRGPTMHDGAKEACRKGLRRLCEEWQIDEMGEFQFPDEMPGQEAFLSAAMNKLSHWVKRTNLFHVLITTLFTVVPRSQEERRGDSTRSILEYLGPTKVDEFIFKVVDALSNIPEPYTAYFALPSVSTIEFDECQLAPGVSIVRSNKAKDPSLITPHSTNSLRLFSGLSNLEIPQNFEPSAGSHPRRYFLAIEVSGYYSPDAYGITSGAIITKLKQTISLAEAIGVMRTSTTSASYVDKASIVNTRTGSIEEKLELPTPISSRISKMQIMSGFAGLGRPVPLGAISRAEYINDSLSTEGLKERCLPLSKCLSQPESHSDILTAAEWLFDSEAERNQTLSYIHAAIGIEAILDSPDENISKTMGDRLAYLVGTTRAERRLLRDKFKVFYGVRSKIVHGKKAKLDSEAEDLLRWGQETLRKAIAREVRFLDP
jgi:hypothetical protein